MAKGNFQRTHKKAYALAIIVFAFPVFLTAKPRIQLSSPSPSRANDTSITLPSDYLPLPIIPQATSYSCGAAALLSVLYYWQAYDGTETDLHSLLETDPEHGTEPTKILETARKLGLSAEMKENQKLEDLKNALKKGQTVILNIQAWPSERLRNLPWSQTWEEGHYVVLVGMDEKNIYVMDSVVATSYAYIPNLELMERWHDYESRNGSIRRYYQLGIYIEGKVGLERYPSAPIRVK